MQKNKSKALCCQELEHKVDFSLCQTSASYRMSIIFCTYLGLPTCHHESAGCAGTRDGRYPRWDIQTSASPLARPYCSTVSTLLWRTVFFLISGRGQGLRWSAKVKEVMSCRLKPITLFACHSRSAIQKTYWKKTHYSNICCWRRREIYRGFCQIGRKWEAPLATTNYILNTPGHTVGTNCVRKRVLLKCSQNSNYKRFTNDL